MGESTNRSSTGEGGGGAGPRAAAERGEAEVQRIVDAHLAEYRGGREQLLPLLHRVEEHLGHLPPWSQEYIAAGLGLSPAEVSAVVSFYEQFSAVPTGRYKIEVCTTLSCQLCGAGELVRHLKERLGVDWGETTSDGKFTLLGVQCLGACGEAPVVAINGKYYTGLSPEQLDRLLGELS